MTPENIDTARGIIATHPWGPGEILVAKALFGNALNEVERLRQIFAALYAETVKLRLVAEAAEKNLLYAGQEDISKALKAWREE